MADVVERVRASRPGRCSVSGAVTPAVVRVEVERAGERVRHCTDCDAVIRRPGRELCACCEHVLWCAYSGDWASTATVLWFARNVPVERGRL